MSSFIASFTYSGTKIVLFYVDYTSTRLSRVESMGVEVCLPAGREREGVEPWKETSFQPPFTSKLCTINGFSKPDKRETGLLQNLC